MDNQETRRMEANNESQLDRKENKRIGERTSKSERGKKHAGRSEETQDPKVWTLEKTRREYNMH